MNVRKLEGESHIPKIPVLVLTGESDDAERNICKNMLGVDEYFNKPVPLQQLTQAIKSILKPKRANSRHEMPLVQNRRKDILIFEDNELCSFLTKQFVSAYNIVVHQAYTLKPVSIHIIYIYICICILIYRD